MYPAVYSHQSSSMTCVTDVFMMELSWTAFNYWSVNIYPLVLL